METMINGRFSTHLVNKYSFGDFIGNDKFATINTRMKVYKQLKKVQLV